jgi:hypothetical protein
MLEVSACKNQVLLRGVWFLTPLRTTKNMKRTAVAMRIWEPMPIPLPVKEGTFSSCKNELIGGHSRIPAAMVCDMFIPRAELMLERQLVILVESV